MKLTRADHERIRANQVRAMNPEVIRKNLEAQRLSDEARSKQQQLDRLKKPTVL